MQEREIVKDKRSSFAEVKGTKIQLTWKKYYYYFNVQTEIVQKTRSKLTRNHHSW